MYISGRKHNARPIDTSPPSSSSSFLARMSNTIGNIYIIIFSGRPAADVQRDPYAYTHTHESHIIIVIIKYTYYVRRIGIFFAWIIIIIIFIMQLHENNIIVFYKTFTYHIIITLLAPRGYNRRCPKEYNIIVLKKQPLHITSSSIIYHVVLNIQFFNLLNATLVIFLIHHVTGCYPEKLKYILLLSAAWLQWSNGY